MSRPLRSAIALVSLIGSGSASAVTLDIDLDTALGFFVNPDPNYSVVVNPASPITVTPNEDLEIWINFVDLDGSGGNGVNAKQHLEVFDLTEQVGQNPNPPQDINVFLNGAGVPDVPSVFFEVEFTGVTVNPGAILAGTVFDTDTEGTNAACLAGLFCTSGPMGADLITGDDAVDRSFFFHDFHILFRTVDFTGEPFEITSLSFGGAADDVAIGTWPVPEPATAALIALGMAALGYRRRAKQRDS